MTSYLIGRLIPQRSPDARALAFSAAGRLARYAAVALLS
jgi:hypothetical protein